MATQIISRHALKLVLDDGREIRICSAGDLLSRDMTFSGSAITQISPIIRSAWQRQSGRGNAIVRASVGVIHRFDTQSDAELFAVQHVTDLLLNSIGNLVHEYAFVDDFPRGSDIWRASISNVEAEPMTIDNQTDAIMRCVSVNYEFNLTK